MIAGNKSIIRRNVEEVENRRASRIGAIVENKNKVRVRKLNRVRVRE